VYRVTFFSEVRLLAFELTFVSIGSAPATAVSFSSGESSPALSFSLVNKDSIGAARRPTAEMPTNTHTSFT
jgi:hypothetical protein